MLRATAPFPHVGCEAYLKKSGEKLRIVRDNGDGTALVAFGATHAVPQLGRIASGNRNVRYADLFETGMEALKGRRRRKRKAA